MTKRSILSAPLALLAIPMLLAVSGCSAPEASTDTAEVDDFAARINGNTPAPSAPTPAQQAAQKADDAPYSPPAPTIAPPRTATGPASATCMANRMGPFMGRLADEATRANIISAAAGAADVRFVQAGSVLIAPDASNPRLNIMLDNQGIIRAARCG